MTGRERDVRDYAAHMALLLRKRGSVLTLQEKNSPRRKLGKYRSWIAVERAIEKYGDDWLRDNGLR